VGELWHVAPANDLLRTDHPFFHLMRLWFLTTLAVLSFVFCTRPTNAQISASKSAPAQPVEQQYTILGISVEGNTTGSGETIIGQSGLYKGQKITFPSDDTRRAIQQLWNESIYSDVQIVVDKEVDQADGTIGIFLTIKVTQFPRMNVVTVSGNKQVKTADIEKALGLHQYQFLRPWELEEGRRRVRALYEKEGYHFADVQLSQTRSSKDTGNSDLVVTINEGSEVTVRHIDFTGNKIVQSDELRSSFEETHEKRWYKIFTSGSFDSKKYDADLKHLILYYQSHGYRDAAVTGDSIWVTNTNDLNIIVHLYEGPQYHVRNIAVVGNEVFTEQDVRDHLGFKRGDVYNIEKFDQNMRGPTPDFNDVGSLYYDRGYVVNINKEEVVVAGDSIDLTLRIQEGKQHFFRFVDVQGNTKTKEFVVRRELFTRPGDAFSRAAIIRSIRQIAQLNYFNQEKLQPDVKMQPDATDVDVTYNVEERSSDTFNASVGYGGSLGLTGSVGVSFNNFDMSDPLHGGGGQVLSVTAEFGQQSYRNISLSFTEPWLFQHPTLLGASIYSVHYAYQYTVDRTGATLTLGRRLKWPDDFFSIKWTLLGQHSNITQGGGIYTPGRHDEVSFEQSISRVSTDNPVFPTSGSEFTLLSRIGYLPLNSVAPNEPANYFKNGLFMRFYTPLAAYGGSNKLVLATTADVGQLGGIGSHPYVPPTERFTMGGSGLATGFYTIALRGYDDASIGISQLGGNTLVQGGLAYMRYVAELRFVISLEPIPFYLLGFAEAGNVWSDFSHSDPFTLKRALGLGARVQVPAVGLIGIDFGYGFDSQRSFGPASGWHTHFQFGHGF
jgi:outer membrane protein insertion porin family